MSRKPIQTELSGGKSQRQRIWEEIRNKGGQDFDVADVTPGDVSLATSRYYIRSLSRAGYLSEMTQATGRNVRDTWSLIRNVGAEAPRVRKNGDVVTQGNGNEAIWGAMIALKTFNVRILAEMAGIKESTTKAYCTTLALAGYLAIDRVGKGMGRGGILTTYRLLTSRIQGPRPPMITRLKAVYDPNIHQIVWQQNADHAIEETEGT